jgi:hypothetical protein
MTSAKYRAPANDAVENRAHLVTRLKFHRDSICTTPFAKLLLLLSLMALFSFRVR